MASAKSDPIRFGIMGCATIARKLSRAISLSPNATVAAIASRSLEKAVAFAEENNLPPTAKAYGSYDAVLEDPNVDAVYIPLPTSLHLKWAVLAAKKKKHVLLEKPVALNVAELDEILRECESSGVQYMDATMWMHHPRTAKMAELLRDESRLGRIKEVHSVLTYDFGPEFLKNNIRVKPDLDSLGALGDMGWYGIRAILWANDYQLPNKATARRDEIEFNEKGVIISCGTSLSYEDGKSATFYCSFRGDLKMEIRVVGEKGSLQVSDFVIPFQEKTGPFYYTGSSGGDRHEEIVETELPQEALMVEEFASLVKRVEENGVVGIEKKWFGVSRKTQAVVDAVKASVDNGFVTVEIVY